MKARGDLRSTTATQTHTGVLQANVCTLLANVIKKISWIKINTQELKKTLTSLITAETSMEENADGC